MDPLKRIIESWKTAGEGAVVFDFFGTLVEVDHDAPMPWQTLCSLGYAGEEALEGAWNSDGFDGCVTPSRSDSPSYDDWRRENLRMMAKHSGVEERFVEDVVRRMLEIDQSWTVRQKQGAADILAFLRARGLRLGLCSNWDYDIRPYLEQARLPSFDAVVTSADVGARKPHERPFRVVCGMVGICDGRVLFVGDSWRSDVIGALRVGLTPVWLTSSSHVRLPKLVGVARSLHDLLGVFESEFGNWAALSSRA